MRYITFELLFKSAGLACLFLIKKSYSFSNVKAVSQQKLTEYTSGWRKCKFMSVEKRAQLTTNYMKNMMQENTFQHFSNNRNETQMCHFGLLWLNWIIADQVSCKDIG